MNTIEYSYYVLCEAEEPIKICFTLESAKKLECEYIDIFDNGGNKVGILKRIIDDGKVTYVSSF
jgi:hypothetical protein